MHLITRKPIITEAINKSLKAYETKGLPSCIHQINIELLQNKVKFPLLEYAAHSLCDAIPEKDQIKLSDQIAQLKTEGGNVLLGIILQRRLDDHFLQSLQKATEYIANGEEWYVCDIIGERVFGYSLLTNPEKTFPEFKRISTHESFWVVRSLGAGGHYAIKKGLDKKYVKKLFRLLLKMSDTRNQQVKQGVGWAAKTTAKFHPDIIEVFKSEIENIDKLPQWFRTKVKIGLERNKYAKRN